MKIECPNCNALNFNYISTNGLEWVYECKNCETRFCIYELAEEEKDAQDIGEVKK